MIKSKFWILAQKLVDKLPKNQRGDPWVKKIFFFLKMSPIFSKIVPNDCICNADSENIYRVSQKKVSLRFCIISRPPRGLEFPSLTFFHRLFYVDSRNIHFVIVWCNFDQDIGKLRINIFSLLLNQELEHSGSLRNTQD